MGLVIFAVALVVIAVLAVLVGRRRGLRVGLATLVVPLLLILEVGFYGVAAAVVLTLFLGAALLAVHEADRRRRSAARDRERRSRRGDGRDERGKPFADAT